MGVKDENEKTEEGKQVSLQEFLEWSEAGNFGTRYFVAMKQVHTLSTL